MKDKNFRIITFCGRYLKRRDSHFVDDLQDFIETLRAFAFFTQAICNLFLLITYSIKRLITNICIFNCVLFAFISLSPPLSAPSLFASHLINRRVWSLERWGEAPGLPGAWPLGLGCNSLMQPVNLMQCVAKEPHKGGDVALNHQWDTMKWDGGKEMEWGRRQIIWREDEDEREHSTGLSVSKHHGPVEKKMRAKRGKTNRNWTVTLVRVNFFKIFIDWNLCLRWQSESRPTQKDCQ